MAITQQIDFPIHLTLFHGTSETIAKNIIAHRDFRIGDPRKDHWLGQGIYFYREDYTQALFWAQYKIRKRRELHGEKAAAIYSNLKIMNSEFLNLDTREGLEYFKKFLEGIEALFIEKGIEINIDDNDPDKAILLMCLYCDMLPQKIKVIQRTYRVESKFFDNDDELKEVGMHLHGVQVCLRFKELIDYSLTGIHALAVVNPFEFRKYKKKKRKISFEEE